jgi:hypothetical protein
VMIAASTAMIPITTRSSTRVKAERDAGQGWPNPGTSHRFRSGLPGKEEAGTSHRFRSGLPEDLANCSDEMECMVLLTTGR